jgi:hypothetical protein
MGYAIQNFMTGRAGIDQLGWFLLIVGLVLNLLGTFLGIAVLCLLAYIPFVLMIYRMFSRNLEKRQRENAAFTGVFRRLRDREHRYFSCPRCHQRVRVPKGKGKISIRCPQCGERFVKKT